LKEIEFGRDGDFNETRFVQVLNADLANDLGNLLNRTLSMAKKYCQLQVPALDVAAIAADHPLKALAETLSDRVQSAYDQLAFSAVCQMLLELAQTGNRYLDQAAPWTRYKEGNTAAVAEILYTVLESVRLVAYWLSPIAPTLSTDIYKQLGYSVDFGDSLKLQDTVVLESHDRWGTLKSNQTLADPTPVFRALELPATD
jgi:methionyl-tRNA synthetase